MTLLLAINSGDENWSAARWQARFRSALPHHTVVRQGADDYDPASIKYAAVWKPAPGLLSKCPNLRVIFNLGAGVDAVLADKSMPAVPLVRIVNHDLTKRMTEYVVLHVLMQHRRMPFLLQAQRERAWRANDQRAAKDVRVGLMGIGEIACDAAEVLLRLGFQVNGWSRSPKQVPGVVTFAGADGLGTFLAATDILVVLLPLTPDTRGILNRKLFSQLARDGVLGAPVLINAGRGGLQVESDILACLDDGTLGGATLDVFEIEPLPATSPLWSHPRVVITPHNAADSDADEITNVVSGQIKAFERGEPLQNVVDRARGY